MSLKINKLYIKNFKVFTEETIKFDSKDFIVFDGPNGFGKTTIYDAIELLFTGTIRRYADIAEKTVKRSQRFKENPYYNTDGDGNEIIIKAEVKLNEEVIVIARISPKKDILDNQVFKHEFESYDLYKSNSFESGLEKVVDEADYLTKLLGVNYKENFEFLNYVEQEESYHLLKNKHSNRKDSINYLFNTKDFQDKIDKINSVKKTIVNLKAPLKVEIDELKSKLDDIKSNLSIEEEIGYKKLLIEKEELWDGEEIDFKYVSISDVLGEEGVIEKIHSLYKNRETLKKYLHNQNVNKYINDELTLKMILKFYNFIGEKEKVIREKGLIEIIISFIKRLEDVNTSNIINGKIDLPDIIKKEFPNSTVVEKYLSKLYEVKGLVNNSNRLSKLYVDVLSTRDNLIKYFENLQKETVYTDKCPLCGNNWGEPEVLLEKITLQTKELRRLSENATNGVPSLISTFINGEIKSLLEVLLDRVNISFYEDEYFIAYFDIDESKLKVAINFLRENEIVFDDLLIRKNNQIENHYEVLKLRLIPLIEEIDEKAIEPYFKDMFYQYFDENFDNIEQLSSKKIQLKKKYITWKYSVFQNSLIAEFEKIRKEKVNIFELSERKIGELEKLLNIYKKSLLKYNDELIKDIELLFHIYTGRILQDFQGGLGLFIDNKNDSLRFITSYAKSYDVLFSMSAGQLSALIISFTLSLNKKYSKKNKILLIDDPVQTMDEINIYGFIELLRNDFSDRQIFISTHESMMSIYMRYKFEKYNLKTKGITVKDLS